MIIHKSNPFVNITDSAISSTGDKVYVNIRILQLSSTRAGEHMVDQVESADVRIRLTYLDQSHLRITIEFLRGNPNINGYLNELGQLQTLTVYPVGHTGGTQWAHIEMWHMHPSGGAGFIWLSENQMKSIYALNETPFETTAFKNPGPGFLFIAIPSSLETT